MYRVNGTVVNFGNGSSGDIIYNSPSYALGGGSFRNLTINGYVTFESQSLFLVSEKFILNGEVTVVKSGTGPGPGVGGYFRKEDDPDSFTYGSGAGHATNGLPGWHDTDFPVYPNVGGQAYNHIWYQAINKAPENWMAGSKGGTTNTGTGGGAGGGIIKIVAKIFEFNGSIRANGGNFTTFTSTDGDGHSGDGGGSGGVVWIVTGRALGNGMIETIGGDGYGEGYNAQGANGRTRIDYFGPFPAWLIQNTALESNNNLTPTFGRGGILYY